CAPGELPKRPKGSDCKSDGSAYGGSNPSLATDRTRAPRSGALVRSLERSGIRTARGARKFDGPTGAEAPRPAQRGVESAGGPSLATDRMRAPRSGALVRSLERSGIRTARAAREFDGRTGVTSSNGCPVRSTPWLPSAHDLLS